MLRTAVPGLGGMWSGCASLIRPIKSCQRFWSTVSNAVPYNHTFQCLTLLKPCLHDTTPYTTICTTGCSNRKTLVYM